MDGTAPTMLRSCQGFTGDKNGGSGREGDPGGLAYDWFYLPKDTRHTDGSPEENSIVISHR